MGACASSLTRWRLVEGFRALLTSEWLAGGWEVLHKCTTIPSCHFSYLLLENNLCKMFKMVVSIAALP